MDAPRSEGAPPTAAVPEASIADVDAEVFVVAATFVPAAVAAVVVAAIGPVAITAVAAEGSGSFGTGSPSSNGSVYDRPGGGARRSGSSSHGRVGRTRARSDACSLRKNGSA